MIFTCVSRSCLILLIYVIEYITIMNEQRLPVTIPGCSSYSVSSKSNICDQNGMIVKPSRQLNITLCGTLRKVRKYVYFVCCMAFHGPKPFPTYTVDHIDRDWTNNDISNLRWASKSLQAKNQHKSSKKGDRVIYNSPTKTVSFKSAADAARQFGIKKTTLHLWLKRDVTVKFAGGVLQYDKLLPEKGSLVRMVPPWILDDNTQVVVRVSTCGLVLKSGRWATGSETGRPAKYFSTSTGEKSKSQVHRLIAAAFLGKPDDPRRIYVNHKDGNGFNNRIGNLEWVSPRENNMHAIETRLVGGLKPVVQYNLDGVRVAEFCTLAEAARSVKGDDINIGNACRGNRLSAYNFMWAFKSEARDQMSPISRGSRKKEIRQYDLDGNLMATFVSGRDAAKALGVLAPRITESCQGKVRLGDFTLKTD